MTSLLEKFYENRGYTVGSISEIDDYSHGLLKDVDVFCERLKHYHDTAGQVVICPDFDMDGAMSAVSFFAGLAELGFNVALYLPDPTEGYGLDVKDIGRLLSWYPDCKAIVTCDVGIASADAANAASSAGIEFLVTDHHVQKPNDVHICASVIVDPMRIDEEYVHPQICGAFVVYQCLQRYADLYCSGDMREQIRRLRVFAGIGTISDGMPLKYENREVVRDAVGILKLLFSVGSDFVVNSIPGCDIYRRAFKGLFVAMKVLSDNGAIERTSDIDEDFIGFYLAPCFNSVKRIGSSCSINHIFDVFFGVEPFEAMSELVELNGKRKVFVKECFDYLHDSEQPLMPYVYICDAPAGILGLVAQKMMNEYNFPTLVLKKSDNGVYHGSGRSPAWFPLMSYCFEHGAVDGGGHEPAFGISFPDYDSLAAYYDSVHVDFTKAFNDVLASGEVSGSVPDFVISTIGDGDVGIDIVLFLEYLSELERLKPFGADFTAPLVHLRFRKEDAQWKLIGSTKQHIRVTLPHGFHVLMWNCANKFDEYKDMDVITLEGNLKRNEFMGNVSVDFIGTVVSSGGDSDDDA